MANKNTITIPRGTDYSFTINYKKDGLPASLVGATIYFTAKLVESDAILNDASAKILKDVVAHTDGPNGISVIALTETDTYVTAGTYFFDVRVKDSEGHSYLLFEGKLKIDGSPTNRNVSV